MDLTKKNEPYRRWAMCGRTSLTCFEPPRHLNIYPTKLIVQHFYLKRATHLVFTLIKCKNFQPPL